MLWKTKLGQPVQGARYFRQQGIGNFHTPVIQTSRNGPKNGCCVTNFTVYCACINLHVIAVYPTLSRHLYGAYDHGISRTAF